METTPKVVQLPSALARRQQLIEMTKLFDTKYQFKVGDIVRWKPGLRNRTVPDYGQPAVVRQIIDRPLDRQSLFLG
jgi:hypothetical protein